MRGHTEKDGKLLSVRALFIPIFEKGFIRAEVIKYNDFITLGSESACKEAGKNECGRKRIYRARWRYYAFRFNV